MNDPSSQNHGPRRARRPAFAGPALLIAIGAFSVLTTAATAETTGEGEPRAATSGGSELFGAETPIGRVEYHAGRGLRLGDTRFTLGGFVNAEANALEGGDVDGGLEGANLFVLFDPLPHVHAFAELESGAIAVAESGEPGVHSSLSLQIERAYGDFGTNDALNVRFGKFLTPIGRWNPVPAEPLTWTASTPLIVENVFDESTTGSMLWGSVFPHGGALSYSLYGAFLDPLDPDESQPPADHTAGAYLEWASLGGWTLGASYFASEQGEGPWNHLGGFDGSWTPSERIELSGEAVFGEGSREDGRLWGLYAQGVVETVDTLYAVARYEHYDPADDGRSLDLFDIGLAWVPIPNVRLKADYRLAVHADDLDLASPGFRSSLSLLF